jgi:hypothetical protein
MAARTPRRTFARPFVVTLAAAPACFVSSPPPQQPPPPQQQPQQQPPPPEQPQPPPVVVTNPPRPTAPPGTAPNPPPPTTPSYADGTRWTVFKTQNGCTAAVKVECPKAEPGHPQPTCNPPPPRAYTCPDNVSLEVPITIVATGGSCFVDTGPVHCPPRVMCNPPPPRPVACPK